MYYLKELIGVTKNGKPKKKTHYKNKDYNKVKAEFIRLTEECQHARSYYVSSNTNV